MRASDLFEQALSLNIGESFSFICHNHAQRESLRVSLQRMVKTNLRNASFDILVQKRFIGEQLGVKVSMVKRIDQIVVEKADGTTEIRKVKAPEEPEMDVKADEMEEFKKAMDRLAETREERLKEEDDEESC
jgi:hypothetical protein